jgi:eukaryotic-like serine/threonine-protein kinase
MLATELFSGTVLGRGREFPISATIDILRDVADALAFAHARGVTHRDLKPSRVMVSGSAAAVTDIGVVPAIHDALRRGSANSTGVTVGSPAYLAPEQVVADPAIDHRADIYSLGAIAYALLTRSPPFAGLPSRAAFAALATLVMQCLEKRPADRPQSAVEVRDALDALNAVGRG